jgi:hypothetical protein
LQDGLLKGRPSHELTLQCWLIHGVCSGCLACFVLKDCKCKYGRALPRRFLGHPQAVRRSFHLSRSNRHSRSICRNLDHRTRDPSHSHCQTRTTFLILNIPPRSHALHLPPPLLHRRLPYSSRPHLGLSTRR